MQCAGGVAAVFDFRRYYGYPLGFGVPVMVLLCGLVVLVAGRKKYHVCPASGSVLATFFGWVYAGRVCMHFFSDVFDVCQEDTFTYNSC